MNKIFLIGYVTLHVLFYFHNWDKMLDKNILHFHIMSDIKKGEGFFQIYNKMKIQQFL